jgi:LmbE family N-acetylglucosaminyl deacetylase
LVHAHPDDEASTTGGVIARYAAEGVRVVLVTCTNGELGDSPAGLAPDHDDHDVAEVVAHRLEELAESCAILGVSRSVLLGYHDSGMMGWPQNDAPESFWQTPVEVAARRLAELFDEEHADVVVTYDENGFYGHPDHIQANRVTLAALELASVEPKLYYSTFPRSAFGRLSTILREHGVDVPDDVDESEERTQLGTPDEQIGAVIDVSGFVVEKRAALEAHASQTASSFFLQLPESAFHELFTEEWFVRVQDPTGQQGVEDDLFHGLR